MRSAAKDLKEMVTKHRGIYPKDDDENLLDTNENSNILD
jgi:hypothetical protein